MTMSPRLRWALGLTLLACLGVALTEAPDEGPVRPMTSARRAALPSTAAASSPAAAAAWPDRPTRIDPPAWPSADARALAAWLPAAPPAASAAPRAAPVLPVSTVPSAPVAPPFPYQLIGRFDDGTASQALLLGATETLGVRAGDVIDGQWRVETVGAGGVSLTWIPAGLRQTVNFRPS